jgi:la-related protein 1
MNVSIWALRFWAYQVWRTVLEGALLEARSGQISAARSVFKYLMEHVPWYYLG